MRPASAFLRSTRSAGVALGVVAALALSACGGGDDSATAATAGADAATATTSAATDGSGPGAQGANPFAAFTECLQEQGLEVTEPTFDGQGGPGGGAPNGSFPEGSFPGGSLPEGATPGDGSFPGGSLPEGVTPGDGSFPGGGGPGGGGGGDFSARIVEMLGLDPDDPAVAAAVEACSADLQATPPQSPQGAAPATDET